MSNISSQLTLCREHIAHQNDSKDHHKAKNSLIFSPYLTSPCLWQMYDAVYISEVSVWVVTHWQNQLLAVMKIQWAKTGPLCWRHIYIAFRRPQPKM